MTKCTNMRQASVRRQTRITPCKCSAARGYGILLLPELRRSSMYSLLDTYVELLRSSIVSMLLYPELRYACSGLSKFSSFGGVPVVAKHRTGSFSRLRHLIAFAPASAPLRFSPFGGTKGGLRLCGKKIKTPNNRK